MLAVDGSMMYGTEGHFYELVPFWTGKGRLTRMIGAKMYNKDGSFIGTWMRAEMPLKLIRQLEAHARYLQLWGFTENGDPPIAERENE